MPSKSEAQAKTMQAAKHNAAFAKKMKIPQKVAAEFVAADEQEKISEADAEGYSKTAEARETQRGGKRGGGGQFLLPKSPKKGA